MILFFKFTPIVILVHLHLNLTKRNYFHYLIHLLHNILFHLQSLHYFQDDHYLQPQDIRATVPKNPGVSPLAAVALPAEPCTFIFCER